MSRSNLPEQTRMKAMRSRCLGSMLAWILKMKPLNSGKSGEISVPAMTRGLGRGRMFQKAVEQELHTEIVAGAAEEDGRALAGEDGGIVENFAGAFEHGQFLDGFVKGRHRRAARARPGLPGHRRTRARETGRPRCVRRGASGWSDGHRRHENRSRRRWAS